MELQETLAEVFGYSSFRPHQESVIRAVLTGRDAFVVMPTGAGKSLCYQFPAAMRRGLVLVISPLIALMKDQVDNARALGIRAAAFNSSLSADQRLDVQALIRQGELELLFVAPERIANGRLVQLLGGRSPALIAIDEAHCVSEWGHDFRPEYLTLGELTELFPGVPIAAFTATATRRVQEDTIARLGLRSPVVVRASFERSNLFYRVRPKNGVRRQVLQIVREHEPSAGIVYHSSRREVERTAEFLQQNGVAALPYHAGLEGSARTEAQERFNRDEVTCIVATIAFGMGIDKPNIRYVVHANLPKGMEQYYQESGRAGRDGEPAVCELLFSAADIHRSRYFLSSVTDERERSRAERSLREIVRYAATRGCRKDHILRYFGESPERESCNSCDVCRGEVTAEEATRDAQIVLSAVHRTGSRFGSGHLVNVITGTADERVRRFGHDAIKTFGAGTGTKKTRWRRIIDELITQGYLEQTDTEFPTLRLTARSQDILFGREKFFVSAHDTARNLPATGSVRRSHSTSGRGAATVSSAGTDGGRHVAVSEGGIDAELFDALRRCRAAIATEQGVPAYVVFHDRTLREMASARPRTPAAMNQIYGVGTAKLQRYGERFLEVVTRHSTEG